VRFGGGSSILAHSVAQAERRLHDISMTEHGFV
jgi:hypothetical protein